MCACAAASVSKTGRLLVSHEAPVTSGLWLTSADYLSSSACSCRPPSHHTLPTITEVSLSGIGWFRTPGIRVEVLWCCLTLVVYTWGKQRVHYDSGHCVGRRKSALTLCRLWSGGGGCDIQALLPESGESTSKGLWL